MRSNKLIRCIVSLPRVVGREPDGGDDGDDASSCGGIRIQTSVTETDDVSATFPSETVDLTVAA